MTRPMPLVAGNWKMNTTVVEGLRLATELVDGLGECGADVAVLPPFTHLVPLAEILRGRGVRLGAQNCWSKDAGAFTGEISPRTVAELCDLVLLGHSERRHLLGESDDLIAAKLVAARAAELTVILAVGETEAERDADRTLAVIDRQLESALGQREGLDGDSLVVAYEPVWAIGTGRTATPAQAEEVCAHIADRLHDLIGDARAVRVLYGGSVTAANASELFAEEHIDGALVGGASLKVADFCAIAAAAQGRLEAGSPSR
jgi:triosephosphate isomerase